MDKLESGSWREPQLYQPPGKDLLPPVEVSPPLEAENELPECHETPGSDVFSVWPWQD